MALVYKDRVKETTLTTGTGAYTLSGAASGFQAFSAVGNGNTVYYAATMGADWEVGLGTWSTGGTLARTTVLASTNSDNAVSWGAGVKTVWGDVPASVFSDIEAAIAALPGSYYSDPLTTRGDILRRGASATERLALGADGTIVSSDGTDAAFRTLSALLDVGIGSTRGMLAARGAATWGSLAVGTSGYVLKSDGTDAAWAAQAWPKGHMDGLLVRFSSVTSIIVGPGQARDYDDATNITLATEDTADISGADLDETTLAATATTHGTQTFEPSASIYSETALSSTVRTLTGTWSTSGTAMTCPGANGNAKAEVKVGDMVRSATNGASRVTAITTNNAITLSTALPGGNVTTEAFTLYENVIVRIAAETPRRINTISHDGLSVVCASSWTSNTSGVAIALGGEMASAFYHLYLASGSSGTGAKISAQRTRPYGWSGYTTAFRRLCTLYNNASGHMMQSRWERHGDVVEVKLFDAATTIVTAGTATSYVARNATAQGVASPLAFELYCRLGVDKFGSNNTFTFLYLRSTELTVDTTYMGSDTWITGWSTVRDNMLGFVPCDSGQDMDYKGDSTNFNVYVTLMGWKERV